MTDSSQPDDNSLLNGPALALVSALLFGASTPLAKTLLGTVDPLLLAGTLYLGSGFGLFIFRSFRRDRREVSLTARDWLWFAPAIFTGGILGPVVLLFGLQMTSASTASLLLVFEGVMTALIAWIVFSEHYSARIGLGMASISLGAVVLAWQSSMSLESYAGPLLIVLACLAWAVDNNLTRKVSLSDPIQIAMVKGLVAGSVNLVLAVFFGHLVFLPIALATGALLGFLCYGVGLVLFVHALRLVGSARTAAYYSVAPFMGALIAIGVLGDPISAQLLLAGLLMSFGVWLHLSERHNHKHQHLVIEHEHSHVHDLHHQHDHGSGVVVSEPHSHVHSHPELIHEHGHFPDAHHTHRHA